MAITECHNGATREEQARWFIEVWEGAEKLRERGVDICAVAAWALIGSHDWNRMVTKFIGHYEVGVFDTRGGTLRPTLMASVLCDLAAGRKPDVPALAGPGWWRRDSRLLRTAPNHEPCYEVELQDPDEDSPRPLLIVGDGDDLARLVVRACEARGLYYARVDDCIETALDRARPWALFDARDHGGICRGLKRNSRGGFCCSIVAQACAERTVPSARITAAPSWAGFDALPSLLEIRTGEVFESR